MDQQPRSFEERTPEQDETAWKSTGTCRGRDLFRGGGVIIFRDTGTLTSYARIDLPSVFCQMVAVFSVSCFPIFSFLLHVLIILVIDAIRACYFAFLNPFILLSLFPMLSLSLQQRFMSTFKMSILFIWVGNCCTVWCPRCSCFLETFYSTSSFDTLSNVDPADLYSFPDPHSQI